ncbi:MAG: C1 family peptidase [Bacteroidales bacterium]|nr:C1 family peptidase [Bacteroidales bacterium]
MRHNVCIMLGEDMKAFVARTAKYIYKYGEGGAEEFCKVLSWVGNADGSVTIKKAELDCPGSNVFVSTTRDQYATRLADDSVLSADNAPLRLRRYFAKLHQQTITVNNGGDSNRLLLSLYLPLYDERLFEQVLAIVEALNDIQQHYSLMVVGLCADLRCAVCPDHEEDGEQSAPRGTAEIEKACIERLARLRTQNNHLEQAVILQNINAAGYALNLDAESLVRIVGELSLLSAEKYDTVFTPATEFDREHPLCSLGLAVMNLDKYYFANYLLRRAYLHLMKREDVAGEQVDLNRVAVVANELLQQHTSLFSDFYAKYAEPLVRQGVSHNAIVSKASPELAKELDAVARHLSDFITQDKFSLPEKRALLAVVLGYDDPFLHGYLFNQQQLTLDHLDADAANVFIDANNALVSIKIDDDGVKTGEHGPLTDCLDDDGFVELPVGRLQQLRGNMREATSYIRQKSRELEDIGQMADDAAQSEKLLTKDGFVVEGNVYRFDAEHQEAKFDENYQPRPVTEQSVDLRHQFAPIKDQGQMGACTVFAVASIFEYILKKSTQRVPDLSESFVYYNVRRAKGEERTDTGSSFQDVIKSIGTEGICTEELHPYSKPLGEAPSAEAVRDGKTRRIVKALGVAVSERDIKSAIQEGYPVAVSLKVFNSFSPQVRGGSRGVLQNARRGGVGASGFVPHPTEAELASGEYGYHAMVVVGYSDEAKHFVVRNSWGRQFGDEGYCYIPYSYICDEDLNRMACIVTEVEAAELGGGTQIAVPGRGDGQNTVVQFNMNDAHIKACVIKSLIRTEQRRLAKMQKEDNRLRRDYEMLMQNLGRQSVRKEILARTQKKLQDKIETARVQQRKINEEERPARLKAFDRQTWQARLSLIAWDASFVLSWIIGLLAFLPKDGEGSFLNAMAEWLGSGWCIGLSACLALGVVCTALYWWWIRSERRRIEMELEERSAKLAAEAQRTEEALKCSQLKFHLAGMVTDSLLSLKTTLDKKYQALKSYIGNLAQWQKEELEASAVMEPLVKNPFIPLLSNGVLDNYFNGHAEQITGQMHLYEYFNNYKFDDESIIAFKRQLKENILQHVSAALSEFTVFRHVFHSMDYPFLDKEYASAERLLPLLDKKSEPFCQLRSNATTRPQAHFLFVRTDAAERAAWQYEYPRHFSTRPISDDILSAFKMLAIRLQPLATNEILLEDTL